MLAQIEQEIGRVKAEIAQRESEAKLLEDARQLLMVRSRTKAEIEQAAPAPAYDQRSLRAKVGPRKASVAGRKRARGLAKQIEGQLKEKGTATAAEVTKAIGANSGSVAYGLRVLEDRGVIRPTGRMVGRTREYEYVGTGQVAEPGSGDLPPGTDA